MLSEIVNYVPFHATRGLPFDYGSPARPAMVPSSLVISPDTFSPADKSSRPNGWKVEESVLADNRLFHCETDCLHVPV